MKWVVKSSQAALCKSCLPGPASDSGLRELLPPTALSSACEHPSMGQKESYFNIPLFKEHLSPEIMAIKSFTPSAVACRKAIYLIYVNPDQMDSTGRSPWHYIIFSEGVSRLQNKILKAAKSWICLSYVFFSWLFFSFKVCISITAKREDIKNLTPSEDSG